MGKEIQKENENLNEELKTDEIQLDEEKEENDESPPYFIDVF